MIAIDSMCIAGVLALTFTAYRQSGPFRILCLAGAALLFAAEVGILLRTLRGGVQIRVTEDAIEAPGLKVPRIPWPEIRSVHVAYLQRTRILCLTLHQPEQFLPRPGTPARRAADLNRALGFGDFALNTMGMRPSFDRLLALVQGHVGSASIGSH